MADDVAITAGSGTNIATDQIGAGHHYQRVKVSDGTADSENHWVIDSSGAAYFVGNVASGAADSGNPVKVGGKYNATPPTLTDGNRGDVQVDSRGNVRMSIVGGNAAVPAVVGNPGTDGYAALDGPWVNGQLQMFNGSTWDRARTIAIGDGAASTGIHAAGLIGYNGSTYDRLRTANTGILQQQGANATAVTGSWTSATALNTAVTVPCAGMTTVVFSLVQGTTITGGVVTFEGDDGSGTWFPLPATRETVSPNVIDLTYTLVASTNVAWTVNCSGFTNVRMRLSTVIAGSATVTARGVASSAQSQPAVAIDSAIPTGSNVMGAVTQSGTWTVQPGNTANSTAWKVDASSVAVPITDNSGSLTVDAPVGTPVFTRLSDGSAALVGQKAMTASLPVTLASDQAAIPVTESGTWTVQPGNTANTTAWLVSTRPGTSGGLSVATGSIAATKTDIKTSAGQVFGWYLYNQHSAASYVQFFNATAANVTLGTTAAVYSLAIPATSGANVLHDVGIAHGTAISIAVTTTRTGSTGPAANIDYNIFYA